MRFLIDLVRFLWEDTKTDIQYVVALIKGKKKITFSKEEIEELKDWRGILKQNWLFFLTCIAAFFAGMFFSYVLNHNYCVELIQRTIDANPQKAEYLEFIYNMTNFTR